MKNAGYVYTLVCQLTYPVLFVMAVLAIATILKQEREISLLRNTIKSQGTELYQTHRQCALLHQRLAEQ